jgi:hypothetical protein
MKIISLHRETNGNSLPDVFTIGVVPSIDGTPIENNPPVKSIKFFETGIAGGKVYRGLCYLIEFEGSNVKRVVPERDILEVAYESDAKASKKLVTATIAENNTEETDAVESE